MVDGRLVDLVPGSAFRRVSVPVPNHDWEDIAADDRGFLWIGDIGDNGCNRRSAVVHKVREPNPFTASRADVAASYPFRWPDSSLGGAGGRGRRGCSGVNSEALVVVDGSPYLISKNRRPGIYAFPSLSDGSTVTLRRVADVTEPPGGFNKLITAADVSRDGRRLLVATAAHDLLVYAGGGGGLSGAALVADLVSRPPAHSQQYRRDGGNEQVEGAAFAGAGYDTLLLSESGKLLYFPTRFYGSAPPRGRGSPDGVYRGSGSASRGSWQRFPHEANSGRVTITLEWDDPGAVVNLFVKDARGRTIAHDNSRGRGGRVGPRRITLDAGRTSIGSIAVKVKRGSTRYTVRVTGG